MDSQNMQNINKEEKKLSEIHYSELEIHYNKNYLFNDVAGTGINGILQARKDSLHLRDFQELVKHTVLLVDQKNQLQKRPPKQYILKTFMVDQNKQDENFLLMLYQNMKNNLQALILEGKGVENINFLRFNQWQNLQEVYVGKNNLLSIDILNVYQQLKVIDAHENQIVQVHLWTQKLVVLNLQSNKIVDFPIFENLNCLKILNLSQNRIENFDQFDVEMTLNLTDLQLNNNKIGFPSVNKFKNDLLDKLRQLHQLENLQLQNNPMYQRQNLEFFEKEKTAARKLILLNCKNIKNLDQKTKQQLQERYKDPNFNQLNFAEPTDPDDELNEQKQRESYKTKHQKKQSLGKQSFSMDFNMKQVPPFEELLHEIEQANLSLEADAEIEILIQYCEEILSQKEIFIKSYYKELNMDPQNIKTLQEQIQYDQFIQQKEPMIENFLQNSVLIIDNQPRLKRKMLNILAMLAFVPIKEFGPKCFLTLTEQIKSSADMEMMVLDVIKTEIINKILEQDPLKLNKFLIEDLRNLIRKNENYSYILDSFFKYCFPKWILTYYQIVIQLKNERKPKKENYEIYDLIINLLALSLRNKNNIIQFFEKGLNKYISEIFNGTERYHNRYLHCLNIIKMLSNYKRIIVDIFIADDVHIKLINSIQQYVSTIEINQLDTKIQELRKQNGFISNDENYQDLAEQNLIYEHFKELQIQTAEIETFGSLLHSRKVQQLFLIKEFQKEILQIFNIFQVDNADPILLRGVCSFALNLFQCFTTSKKNSDDQIQLKDYMDEVNRMEPFVKKIDGLKKLLSYFGGSNFTNLLFQTRRYQKAQIKTGNLIFSIDLVDQGIINRLRQLDIEVKKENDIIIEIRNDFVQGSLRKLKSVIINDLFYSIIYIIKFFTFHGTNMTNKHYIEASKLLNENKRNYAIFSALEIKNTKLKIACVDCLFDVDLDDLKENEVQQILFVLQNTKNINEGEVQIVLSFIFLVLTKFVLCDYNKNKSSKMFQKQFGQSSIDLGLEFLKIVLSRVVQEEDTEKEQQKFQLSLSIINFLKAASNSDLMIKFFYGKKEIFKQILINEDRYSSIQVKEVPINIENTIIGRDIISCIECMTGTETIQPYSDVSLRIIIRIADILMNNQKFFFCKIDDPGIKDPIKVIKQFQIEAYKMRKSKESTYWVDINNLFFVQLKKQDREYLSNQHYNFTYSNGVALILNFLTKKSKETNEMLEAICDPNFDSKLSQINSSKKKSKLLFEELQNYKKYLEQKFIKQYVGKDVQQNMFKLNNTITQKVKQEYQKSLQSIHNYQNNQNSSDLTCRNSSKSFFQQNFQYEEFGQEFSSSIFNTGLTQNQKLKNERIIEDLFINQNKNKTFDKYEEQMLYKRNDGFQNFELRVLSIAAFLRCLNASIEYAPTYQLKKKAIQNIKDPISFRCITQLCDSTDWDEERCIGSKYMHIMRQLIKVSIKQEKEDFDNMIYYNIISIVIQRIVQKIRNKVLQNAQLNEKDYMTNYETCMTFFIILQQTNYFIFSEMDIVRVHKENQMKIEMFDKNIQQKLSKSNIEQAGGYFTEDFNQNSLKLKCEHQNGAYQNMVRLRKKRSVQTKLVEHFILQLLNKQTIYSFIDSFFTQMKQEQKLFEDAKKMNQEKTRTSKDEKTQNDSEVKEQQQNNQNIEESDSDNSNIVQQDDDQINLQGNQKIKVYQTIEFAIDLKNNLTINKIKDIIGLLIAFCPKKFKYEIIEYVIKKCTLERQIFRQSFIQEINDSARDNQFELNMQNYITQNHFSCESWGNFANQNSIYKHERILCQCYSDMNHTVAEIKGLEDIILFDAKKKVFMYDKFDDINIQNYVNQQVELVKETNFVKRLFILTNNGIQILKDIPDNLKCKKCPVYQFCPRGPSQDFCINFKDIETIVLFAQIPQKIVIKYKTDISMPNSRKKIGCCHYQLTLNMPTLRAATKIKKELQAVFQACAEEIEIQKQKNANIYDQQHQQEKKLNQSYVDILIQNELKHLVHKITGKDFTKDEKTFLDFQFVHLFSTNFVSEAFFNQVIKTNIDRKPNIRQFGSEIKIDQLYIENQDKSIFINCSLIGVYGDYIIILKEKWNNWKFVETYEELQEYKSQQNSKNLLPYSQQNEAKKDQDLLYQYYPENDFQKQMMKYCISIKSRLFTPVICFKMDRNKDDFQVKINQGIYSSVEMTFREDFKIQVIFTSDMIRQKFVNSVWNWYNQNDENSKLQSEKSLQKTEQGQEELHDSDEEDIDPIIYE